MGKGERAGQGNTGTGILKGYFLCFVGKGFYRLLWAHRGLYFGFLPRQVHRKGHSPLGKGAFEALPFEAAGVLHIQVGDFKGYGTVCKVGTGYRDAGSALVGAVHGRGIAVVGLAHVKDQAQLDALYAEDTIPLAGNILGPH